MLILFKRSAKYIFYLLLIFASHLQAASEIVFTAGASLKSYQPSIIVPILTEAFKRNGIKFRAVHHPSLRSLMLSNGGRYDGELHRVYDFHQVSDGKYPNLIRIESKLLSVWLSVFSTKGISISGWDSLKGYSVAYYRGRKDVEINLNKVLAPKYINRVNTDEQAFAMLAAGRVDIVISESLQGNMIVESHPNFFEIVEVAKISESKIYSYMHLKHQEVATEVAKILNGMKQDGSFLKITDQVNLRFRTQIHDQ
ncbi:MAG: transporter substrate-binding domain-containing protein [Moritella sp.]|uniref:substrate-binding periplasmic protein n=1 Tax=Moritella sp. TaxID=78556 RepID=UPI001DFE3084|nr:transporter substrate-binding domain-containing protein [Moritella sp.]NQZ52468.1 transporter substrate-binding domain-containing protein [Moritella sp.]